MARGVPVNVIDAVVVETRLYPEHERGADLAVLIKGVGSGTEGLVALAEGEGRAVRYGGEIDRGREREREIKRERERERERER